MNERIKQLAEQAGGYVSLTYEHDGKLILSGEDIVQKFAQLIVRECARVGSDIVLNQNEDNDMGVFLGIKHHFGVEE